MQPHWVLSADDCFVHGINFQSQSTTTAGVSNQIHNTITEHHITNAEHTPSGWLLLQQYIAQTEELMSRGEHTQGMS
jgi:hypothetical protein